MAAPLRVGAQPLPEGLQRDLVGRQQPVVDQVAADRGIRVPVLAVVVEAHDRAVLQLDAGGPLDVHEEGIDRAVEVDELQALAGKRTVFDLGPRRKRRSPGRGLAHVAQPVGRRRVGLVTTFKRSAGRRYIGTLNWPSACASPRAPAHSSRSACRRCPCAGPGAAGSASRRRSWPRRASAARAPGRRGRPAQAGRSWRRPSWASAVFTSVRAPGAAASSALARAVRVTALQVVRNALERCQVIVAVPAVEIGKRRGLMGGGGGKKKKKKKNMIWLICAVSSMLLLGAINSLRERQTTLSRQAAWRQPSVKGILTADKTTARANQKVAARTRYANTQGRVPLPLYYRAPSY